MSAPNLKDLTRQIVNEITRKRDRVIPVKVGNAAINLTKKNFRDAGFNDGGLKPWKKTKRQIYGKKASDTYTPLLSSRNRLYSSFEKKTKPGYVNIFTRVEYAQVHNDGFEGNVSVREHSRMQNNKRVKVRAHQRYMKIPKRQFLGDSKDLNKVIDNIINKELGEIAEKYGKSSGTPR